MEFHDLLHGRISFEPGDELTDLISDLLKSPEINRLRNMRQMNFDVPLIQELGRSRRLPHSIGVTHIARDLAKRSALDSDDSKTLIAAALLHDAAIPPYGHLVESEFKSKNADFRHEKRVQELIFGTGDVQNKYMAIVPHKSLELSDILKKYSIDPMKVIKLICPKDSEKSPISADIDIDNIDNIHRMAAMLGWSGASENLRSLIANTYLRKLGEMAFSKEAMSALERWLDYRQKIYTMIIAHPECIPYNALQADLVRQAINEDIITPDRWHMIEPIFEEKLRNSKRLKTRKLAEQLLSGCEYQTVDYIWFKGFSSKKKLHNANIVEHLNRTVTPQKDYGYFIWNERGLIGREVKIIGSNWSGGKIGSTSTSCMIALVKKSTGKARWSKTDSSTWRRKIAVEFTELFETHNFEVDYPETYTGDFYSKKNSEIQIDYF